MNYVVGCIVLTIHDIGTLYFDTHFILIRKIFKYFKNPTY